MNPQERFKVEYFDLLLVDFKQKIMGRAHGNYSKSYESFKRINNTEILFRKALRDHHHLSVLDVGCGDGYHLCVFNTIDNVEETVRFCGIDKSEKHVEFASRVCRELQFKNINFLVGSAEALPFPVHQFDIILCSDVVEHLPYPEKCFAEMFSVLKPGGIAIVTTPNETHPLIRVGAYMRGKDTISVDDEEHISLKGMKEWIKISTNAGFNISGVRRGALIFGGYPYNRRPVLFSFIILIDQIFDRLPFLKNWGEAITLQLSKSGNL
jgi:ubiquinone/menaquinone biosynthesis C-methylase UbiE